MILELVGAPHMADNMTALARRGRLMLVGAKPGEEAAIVLRDLMTARAHLIGTTLRTRPPRRRRRSSQEFARRIVPCLASGRATAAVERMFPLEDDRRGAGRTSAPPASRQALLEMPAA